MLRNRVAAVDGEIARSAATLSGVLEQPPRLWLVEVEYLQGQREAEARWLRALIADIESGALSWGRAGPDDANRLSDEEGPAAEAWS